jgi:hypothetical protein
MVRLEAWSFCGDFLGPMFTFWADARSGGSVYQALPAAEKVSHHQIHLFFIIMVSEYIKT